VDLLPLRRIFLLPCAAMSAIRLVNDVPSSTASTCEFRLSQGTQQVARIGVHAGAAASVPTSGAWQVEALLGDIAVCNTASSCNDGVEVSMRRQAFVCAFLLCVLSAAPAWSGATAVLCGDSNECVCITWISGATATTEVRCPSGTTNPPPGGAVGSTVGGTGIPQAPAAPYPGNPIMGATSQTLSRAKELASEKLQGEFDPELRRYVANECTDLFLESPLNRTGRSLLNGYVVFRSGQGVQDSSGRIPCDGSTAAWTRCCSHSPYVFICDNQFNQRSTTNGALVIIHELLHVGGQREDQSSTVGPADPPNSGQINDVVAKACS
jgi:hypothetical protein